MLCKSVLMCLPAACLPSLSPLPGPDDLHALFSQLGSASDKQKIPVSNLLALAAQGLRGAPENQKPAASKADAGEVVAIHIK